MRSQTSFAPHYRLNESNQESQPGEQDIHQENIAAAFNFALPMRFVKPTKNREQFKHVRPAALRSKQWCFPHGCSAQGRAAPLLEESTPHDAGFLRFKN